MFWESASLCVSLQRGVVLPELLPSDVTVVAVLVSSCAFLSLDSCLVSVPMLFAVDDRDDSLVALFFFAPMQDFQGN